MIKTSVKGVLELILLRAQEAMEKVLADVTMEELMVTLSKKIES